jgi:hypothetical protein
MMMCDFCHRMPSVATTHDGSVSCCEACAQPGGAADDLLTAARGGGSGGNTIAVPPLKLAPAEMCWPTLARRTAKRPAQLPRYTVKDMLRDLASRSGLGAAG